MKKAYITPNARILSVYTESTLLTGSMSKTDDGDKSEPLGGGGGDETWSGEFSSNRRGGGMWDDM